MFQNIEQENLNKVKTVVSIGVKNERNEEIFEWLILLGNFFLKKVFIIYKEVDEESSDDY